ncbi:hypothetical protein CPter291_3473 [Collimonas pratensis]|uniref:Uncharacterized protein n=1 Tax=Collimonas pratensis TaxID=279113 RepID=A0ABM5ZA22_9BURK|nr:hypothetical protein CPter291_3473 [Collimonas pratensis]
MCPPAASATIDLKPGNNEAAKLAASSAMSEYLHNHLNAVFCFGMN